MSLTINDLKTALKNGSSLVLDAKNLKPIQMRSLCELANKHGAEVTILNSQAYSSLHVKTISEKGGTSVVFDFTTNET